MAGVPDFGALFAASPDQYLVLSTDFTILAASDAYLAATRTQLTDIIGRIVFDVFPDDPSDPGGVSFNLRSSLERVMTEGRPDAMAVLKYDIPRPEADGGGIEERFWSPLNSPVLAADGTVEYIINRVEDVTPLVQLQRTGNEQAAEIILRAQELQRVNQELRVANERLAELDRAESAFFSNISHEFRTPLTLILGQVDRLASGAAAEPVRESVRRNSRLLLRQVNDLLDAAKLESGQFVLDYESVDLAGLFSIVVDAFSGVVERKNQTLTLHAPEPIRCDCDAANVERILLNLVGNATKFTPQGGRIECEVASAGDAAELWVRDDGPGVPCGIHDVVFERFRQVDGTLTREQEGTGLGLSIARDIATLHGGSVEFVAHEGPGAWLRVRLPLKAPAGRPVRDTSSTNRGALPDMITERSFDQDELESNPAEDTAHESQGTVLLAEDNAELAAHIRAVLSPDFDVLIARDGNRAFEIAVEAEPDVILSDLMMPGFSGVDLVRSVRSSGALDSVAIVILTAKQDDALRDELLEAGVSDYLVKPFSPIELRARVRNLVVAKRSESALRDAEELFRRGFEEAPIGMAMLDLTGRFLQVNEALSELVGYDREELLQTTLTAVTHPDDRGEDERQLEGALAGESSGYRSEKRLLHSSRRPVWVSMQTTVVRDADGRPLRLLAQIQDTTDRRHYEERLVFLANHDPLTGLLNRRSFERELANHGALGSRIGGTGAAIMLDLDHFKLINDTLGHRAGDQAISRAASVFRARLRKDDVLARLGGDEFAVLLRSAGEQEALDAANGLLQALRKEAIDIGMRTDTLTASAGIAVFSPDSEFSAEDVLIHADLALYDAKNAGRDRAQMYDLKSREKSEMKGRVTWSQRIRNALDNDGFTLLAQPIVDLSTDRTSHHELLLRMRDEHGDLIPPATFLYVAERLGFVREIDRWVTDQAFRLLAEHHSRGKKITLEVNLSGLSIGDPELLALISHRVGTTGISAEHMIFEITEMAAVIDMPRASQFARDINRIGCRFALDDFGAGYGSFHYLKDLPFDFLKIDGEFVRGCRTSETDRLLIKAVVDIATGMGKRTIAEFIGDEETARLLKRLGVDYGQGYHFGRPTALIGSG